VRGRRGGGYAKRQPKVKPKSKDLESSKKQPKFQLASQLNLTNAVDHTHAMVKATERDRDKERYGRILHT